MTFMMTLSRETVEQCVTIRLAVSSEELGEEGEHKIGMKPKLWK